jgi:hypothetical protein
MLLKYKRELEILKIYFVQCPPCKKLLLVNKIQSFRCGLLAKGCVASCLRFLGLSMCVGRNKDDRLTLVGAVKLGRLGCWIWLCDIGVCKRRDYLVNLSNPSDFYNKCYDNHVINSSQVIRCFSDRKISEHKISLAIQQKIFTFLSFLEK